MDDVICDDLHLSPEKISEKIACVNIKIMVLWNHWYSWRKKHNAGTVLYHCTTTFKLLSVRGAVLPIMCHVYHILQIW